MSNKVFLSYFSACNCVNTHGNFVDVGYITASNLFPIKEMKYGDVDQSHEYIYHTLGPLMCPSG